MLRSVLPTKPWLRDPAVVPIPFRQDRVNACLSRAKPDGSATESALPLKLGILWSHGVVGVHLPVRRGLEMVVDAVVAGGHQVSDPTPNLS